MKVEKHERVYRELKSKGFSGWGGEKYETRMNGWDSKFKLLFESLDKKKFKILELGCGAGDASIKLAEMGHEVTGIDISPTAIQWAKEKSDKLLLDINFYSENVCKSDLLQNEKFEIIIDGCCLHCLFDNDRLDFYRNVHRLLKPEGLFFINSAALKKADDPIPKLSSIERCVIPQRHIETELKEFGFKIVKSWVQEHSKHNHYSAICRKL